MSALFKPPHAIASRVCASSGSRTQLPSAALAGFAAAWLSIAFFAALMLMRGAVVLRRADRRGVVSVVHGARRPCSRIASCWRCSSIACVALSLLFRSYVLAVASPVPLSLLPR